jgi:ABC-type amino acid transport substrate-binding protein
MNAGKTVAATELVRGLARGGFKVAAAKLTGVSLMRDALAMVDAGASAALTFNDVGIASTHPGVTVATAKGIFNRLAAAKPDVIVAELGDGILGEYGVQDILRDVELTNVGAAYVMAAPDPVACWGATELMRTEFGLPITVITGPATDNEVGQVYIQSGLGLPAHNARRDAAGLLKVVREALEQWIKGRGSRVEDPDSPAGIPEKVDSRLLTLDVK